MEYIHRYQGSYSICNHTVRGGVQCVSMRVVLEKGKGGEGSLRTPHRDRFHSHKLLAVLYCMLAHHTKNTHTNKNPACLQSIMMNYKRAI